MASMSTMLDVTERARPIMEYVRTLETKVRYYRAAQGRVSRMVFFSGFVAGAVTGATAMAILASRYILHH